MEEVSENRNTFATHRNAKCPLKHTFTKYNEYIVKQIFEHFDMSFRELFGRISVVCFNKIRQDKVFVSTLAILWVAMLN